MMELIFLCSSPSQPCLMNGNSELDGNSAEFDGSNTYRGVNPATGAVIYYQLPELKEKENITLDIKDAQGNLVRSFTSQRDSTAISVMMVRLRQTPHYRNQKDLIVSFGIYGIQP
jgi:hypothetical protein